MMQRVVQTMSEIQHVITYTTHIHTRTYRPSRSKNPTSGCSRVYDHETVLAGQKTMRGQRR